MPDVIIKISEGLIKGKSRIGFRNQRYFSFQGIPYGQPPIDHLRFKAPQPSLPWKDIKDCRNEGDPCYSRHIFLQNIIGSEDCLILNVFTPELPAQDRNSSNGGGGVVAYPVMVWIHGGAFLCGSSAFEIFNPEYLLWQNVIVVTINYRIGILGFLSLDDPSLGVPGNAGLKDIVLSLNWIRRNIAYFQGDPGNVTIFGSSAGAAAVHYLMLSPLAKGLFHRAIAQSGCALNPWASGGSCYQELGSILNRNIDNEQELFKLLQAIPVKQLLEAQEKLNNLQEFCANKRRLIGPVIEKVSVVEANFITRKPYDIIKSGDYNKVPLLIGYASMEGALFDINQHNSQINFEYLIPHSYAIKCGTKLSEFITSEMKQFYSINNNFYNILRDSYFLEGIYHTVKLHAETSSTPIYCYRISIETKLNFFKNLWDIPTKGACHGDELGYLFKMAITPNIEAGSVEETAIIRFTTLWCNFARKGNPNPIELDNFINIYWRPIDKNGEVHVLDIGNNLEMTTCPELARMQFWDRVRFISQNRNCRL